MMVYRILYYTIVTNGWTFRAAENLTSLWAIQGGFVQRFIFLFNLK